jgi:hypothetical protein
MDNQTFQLPEERERPMEANMGGALAAFTPQLKRLPEQSVAGPQTNHST